MPELARFDGCEVVKKLHTGPITDLYQGIQEPLGRKVFIKALGSSISPSSPFAASLEREARLLAELSHPNIVKVYDFVRRGERMWLVLEYVDGPSLDEILKKMGRLPEAAACAIALEVARALEHAHAKGVVHRDIQPRNILIAQDGSVRLMNFSVAADQRLTTAPELLEGGAGYGGPSYMSPEQILGERADGRADVFSLGIVLYELLSGERPFDGPDDLRTSLRIRRDPVPSLGRAVPRVNPALERITQHCLEKMPSDRYQTCTELAAALEQARGELAGAATADAISTLLVQSGFKAGSAPPSVGSRLPTARRSTPGGTIAGLLVALLLIIAGGFVIQFASGKHEGRGQASRGGHQLELLPVDRAYLRVIARPWAYVIVDGQRVETTPFARPIPLAAGTHYVRLEHPNAPTERRTVELAPSETLLLEVTLKVSTPKGAPSDTPAPLDGLVPDAGDDSKTP